MSAESDGGGARGMTGSVEGRISAHTRPQALVAISSSLIICTNVLTAPTFLKYCSESYLVLNHSAFKGTKDPGMADRNWGQITVSSNIEKN
jgi:hypothetical protein